MFKWKTQAQTIFISQNQHARELSDPFGHPYHYELCGKTFLIRSFGADGIPSNDDIIFKPD